MTATDINLRLYDSPFRPFRVHLSDGTAIPITNAGTVMVTETTALLPIELGKDEQGFPIVKRWRTVTQSHMVQLTDIDEPVMGKRPKRRG